AGGALDRRADRVLVGRRRPAGRPYRAEGSSPVSAPDPAAVRVQRVIAAPPETVYDEWLDAEALREWMGPRPARATRVELDPRVGGRLRIDIEDSGDRVVVTGQYLELDRPHRLAFTWRSSAWGEERDSVVTVTFQATSGGRTLMTIHHVRLPDRVRPGYQPGWARIVEQFDQSLTTRQRSSRAPGGES